MTTQKRYEILRNELNEQQWRLYLGTEALTIGYGVISQVAALSGADWKTVQRGVKGLKGEQLRAQGKIQQVGGGRKEEQLTITLAHYAPATSKWNKIEHRLFSFISLIVRRMADFHFHQATSWEEMERIHRKWVRDPCALAARSLTYNFGPGWEPLFWEAYGLQTVDRTRIEFYQLLDEFF